MCLNEQCKTHPATNKYEQNKKHMVAFEHHFYRKICILFIQWDIYLVSNLRKQIFK